VLQLLEQDKSAAEVSAVGMSSGAQTSTAPAEQLACHKRVGAVVDQELEQGVRSVAAPLHDASGAVIAALNVSAHAARISLETLRDRFVPAVRATAELIDADLRARR